MEDCSPQRASGSVAKMCTHRPKQSIGFMSPTGRPIRKAQNRLQAKRRHLRLGLAVNRRQTQNHHWLPSTSEATLPTSPTSDFNLGHEGEIPVSMLDSLAQEEASSSSPDGDRESVLLETQLDFGRNFGPADEDEWGVDTLVNLIKKETSADTLSDEDTDSGPSLATEDDEDDSPAELLDDFAKNETLNTQSSLEDMVLLEPATEAVVLSPWEPEEPESEMEQPEVRILVQEQDRCPSEDSEELTEEDEETALDMRLNAAEVNAKEHAAIFRSARSRVWESSGLSQEITGAETATDAEAVALTSASQSERWFFGRISFGTRSEVCFLPPEYWCSFVVSPHGSGACSIPADRPLYTKDFDGPSGHKCRRGRLSFFENQGYEEDEWENLCDGIAELMNQQRNTNAFDYYY